MSPHTKASPALAAARDIMIDQERPHRGDHKRLTIRAAADRYHVSISAVHRQLKSLKQSGKPAYSETGLGRPRSLNDSEERAVVAYIIWLERAGFPATRQVIEEAANRLRSLRTPSAPPVGHHWYRRFLADNPQLEMKRSIRAFERDRAGFECGDVDKFERFYAQLDEHVKHRKLTASQIFNADECGIRIGALQERLSVVVVKKERNTKHEVVSFTNRESTTMIGCANAAGSMVPPMMVFKTWPTQSWDIHNMDEGVRFARSETGFSNAEISMEWIRHFNYHSFSLLSEVKSRGLTFTNWFGCNQYMEDPDRPEHIWHESYIERPEKDRIWRLLVIDGFTGKTSLELMDYCLRFDIELCILPPHSTHLTQPLDVGVFQPLKMAHQRVVRQHIRDGNLHFNRSDFIAKLQEITDAGFTTHNILNGFENSGIFPVNGSRVIHALKEKNKSILAMSAPSIQSPLPKDRRFKDAIETARHIRHNYLHCFDSETRQAFRVVEDVLSEAVFLSSFAESHIKSRQDRAVEMQVPIADVLSNDTLMGHLQRLENTNIQRLRKVSRMRWKNTQLDIKPKAVVHQLQ